MQLYSEKLQGLNSVRFVHTSGFFFFIDIAAGVAPIDCCLANPPPRPPPPPPRPPEPTALPPRGVNTEKFGTDTERFPPAGCAKPPPGGPPPPRCARGVGTAHIIAATGSYAVQPRYGKQAVKPEP